MLAHTIRYALAEPGPEAGRAQVWEGVTCATRGGFRAKIYATGQGGDWPIHGAVKVAGGWRVAAWQADGRQYPGGAISLFDLAGGRRLPDNAALPDTGAPLGG